MELNTLGIVLSYYREKEKLSLDKVCGGLCSVVTLERIEQGERIADSLLGGLLLERIGKEVAQFELMLNEEDYTLWRMREDIRKAMRLKDYGLLRAKIDEYRSMKKSYAELHEQFCLYYEAMMETAKNEKDYTRICQTALLALQMTKPKFDREDEEAKTLYTQMEIRLILMLIHYGYIDSADKAENELLKLLSYVEYFYTERKKEETGIAIITELVKLEKSHSDDEKTLVYINKGIHFLSQGRGIKGLEKLHFLKAQILAHRYNNSAGQITVKQEIHKECLMAYCICEVMGFTEKMKEIETFCEEKLAWQITGLEM